jgi:predicted membrane protein
VWKALTFIISHITTFLALCGVLFGVIQYKSIIESERKKNEKLKQTNKQTKEKWLLDSTTLSTK